MNCHDFGLKIKNIIECSDREDAYFKLAATYLNSPGELRKQIRTNWDYGVKWIYPNQRRLACSKNEKRSRQERILASLVYDSIEDLRDGDLRDRLVGISVIYHSCIEAGLNPEEEFEKVASISSEKTAIFLRNFIHRKPEDKSKEAFMLKTAKNSDGETEICPFWI